MSLISSLSKFQKKKSKGKLKRCSDDICNMPSSIAVSELTQLRGREANREYNEGLCRLPHLRYRTGFLSLPPGIINPSINNILINLQDKKKFHFLFTQGILE